MQDKKYIRKQIQIISNKNKVANILSNCSYEEGGSIMKRYIANFI